MSDADSDEPTLLSSPPSSSASRVSAGPAPRRSTRTRRKPTIYPPPPASPVAEPTNRDYHLEQIPYSTATSLSLAPPPRITLSTSAAALINFHAHLAKTEVIGYLAGTQQHVCANGASEAGAGAGAVKITVVDAYPCKSLTERALAKDGRSAYTEVEVDPASSVEVMSRIVARNLQVVGWYHSHPDASFTVEPSRVDIENQHNYQQLLFRDKPFVAAIIAPYNQDLPDHNADLQFFRVHQADVPLQLGFDIHGMGGGEGSCVHFVGECQALIEVYRAFRKRVRLEKEWRPGICGVEKLKRVLYAFGQGNDRLERCFEGVINTLECAWRESANDAVRSGRGRGRGIRKRNRRN